VRGIPGTVADRSVGKARVGAGLSAGGAGGIRGMHADGERGERRLGFERGQLSSAGQFWKHARFIR
jgi:hypothetical protein